MLNALRNTSCPQDQIPHGQTLNGRDEEQELQPMASLGMRDRVARAGRIERIGQTWVGEDYISK